MVVFPNAKINLGLNVVEKRNDGYHNILSVFYPVNLCDGLEFVENSKSTVDNMHLSGFKITGNSDENLVLKALQLMRSAYAIPPLEIYLHKNIPMGAGLGGGSADAGFFLKALNTYFNLGLTTQKLMEVALELGSDCPFFINNAPADVGGRGERISSIRAVLKGYYIVIALPDIHISTAAAYREMDLNYPAKPPSEVVLNMEVTRWKEVLHNDFEPFAFRKFPELEETKSALYRAGAIYASMTGSGSAIYGIFDKKPEGLARFVSSKCWGAEL